MKKLAATTLFVICALAGCAKLEDYFIESRFRVLDSDKVMAAIYKGGNPATSEGVLTIYTSKPAALVVYGVGVAIRIEGNIISSPREAPDQYPDEWSLVSPEWRINFLKPAPGDIIYVRSVSREEKEP